MAKVCAGLGTQDLADGPAGHCKIKPSYVYQIVGVTNGCCETVLQTVQLQHTAIKITQQLGQMAVLNFQSTTEAPANAAAARSRPTHKTNTGPMLHSLSSTNKQNLQETDYDCTA